jgi:hypothetical protein
MFSVVASGNKSWPVGLDFVGLDRIKDTPRSTNETEEDGFCDRLQKFGPIWYEDELWYRYSAMGITSELPYEFPDGCSPSTPQKPPTFYGYPSTGGLWVLELANDNELRRKRMGQLRNVFTMDEKSKVIEAMGGKFYTDSDNYWAAQEKQPLIWYMPNLIERSWASHR